MQRGETVVAHGAGAANTLGLTTQVPVRQIFLNRGSQLEAEARRPEGRAAPRTSVATDLSRADRRRCHSRVGLARPVGIGSRLEEAAAQAACLRVAGSRRCARAPADVAGRPGRCADDPCLIFSCRREPSSVKPCSRQPNAQAARPTFRERHLWRQTAVTPASLPSRHGVAPRSVTGAASACGAGADPRRADRRSGIAIPP